MWSRWKESYRYLYRSSQSEWEGEKLLPASGRPTEPHRDVTAHTFYPLTWSEPCSDAWNMKRRGRVWGEGGCGEEIEENTGPKEMGKNIVLSCASRLSLRYAYLLMCRLQWICSIRFSSRFITIYLRIKAVFFCVAHSYTWGRKKMPASNTISYSIFLFQEPGIKWLPVTVSALLPPFHPFFLLPLHLLHQQKLRDAQHFFHVLPFSSSYVSRKKETYKK